jgi:hypothetical protein
MRPGFSTEETYLTAKAQKAKKGWNIWVLPCFSSSFFAVFAFAVKFFAPPVVTHIILFCLIKPLGSTPPKSMLL